jgi:hypothetical protein
MPFGGSDAVPIVSENELTVTVNGGTPVMASTLTLELLGLRSAAPTDTKYWVVVELRD